MSVAEIEAREIQLNAPAGGLWTDAWSRLRRNPGAITGTFIVLSFVVLAIFAPLIAPYSPKKVNLDALGASCCPGPSGQHWLGVDQLGRDELSRIVYGARYSLVIGLVAVAAGLSIGLLLGAVSGYFGGLTDSIVMRCMDVMLAIPGLLLAIIDVAGLGFLGLGPQDPGTPEWGTMLTQVDLYLQSAPFLAIAPGIAIVLLVLGFNLIGDGLREALDPKLRGRTGKFKAAKDADQEYEDMRSEAFGDESGVLQR